MDFEHESSIYIIEKTKKKNTRKQQSEAIITSGATNSAGPGGIWGARWRQVDPPDAACVMHAGCREVRANESNH